MYFACAAVTSAGACAGLEKGIFRVFLGLNVNPGCIRQASLYRPEMEPSSLCSSTPKRQDLCSVSFNWIMKTCLDQDSYQRKNIQTFQNLSTYISSVCYNDHSLLTIYGNMRNDTNTLKKHVCANMKKPESERYSNSCLMMYTIMYIICNV